MVLPAIAVSAAVGTAASAACAWAVRGRSANVLADSVWHGDRARRAIALTFDDGPSPATLPVLELLDRYQMRATFFQCGENAQRYPEWSQLVRKAGHEIGNHTWSHPNLAFSSRQRQRQEIAQTQNLLRDLHGESPHWFRAPYGVRWLGLGGVQKELELSGAMWSCIGLDWKLDSRGIFHRVMAGTQPGAIVCLHDGATTQAKPDRTQMLGALRQLLPWWREEGYKVAQLSDIL